jgi:signal transduction histidine kinase
MLGQHRPATIFAAVPAFSDRIILMQRPAPRPTGLLAGMRIRKKLMVLHTVFSLALAGILGLALWPAVNRIVAEAELHESRLALSTTLARMADRRAGAEAAGLRFDPQPVVEALNRELPPGVRVAAGPVPPGGVPSMLGPLRDLTLLDGVTAGWFDNGSPAVFAVDERAGLAYLAAARMDSARAEVSRLLIVVTLALLVVYASIALALEAFILPKHVYGPIRAMLDADQAAREGRTAQEIIPDPLIPADELGEIMRSRNRTIDSLREKERSLARADRLAALGMLSAGLAHELNTPLAVAKGLVERLASDPSGSLSQPDCGLLLRVIGRLERLSESLLDYARARPPRTAPVSLAPLVEEAWTLVRLDREARAVRFAADIPPDLIIEGDADRLMQVLVNLLRNALDALDGRAEPSVTITAKANLAANLATITVDDNGPGLDPGVAARLFEPFASTRLDARGTGLGLAVSEGIIKEHGGSISARTRTPPEPAGTRFEITLPLRRAAEPVREPARSPAPVHSGS